MITIKSKGKKTVLCETKQGSLVVFPEGDIKKGEAGKRFLLDKAQDQQVEGVISWPGEYDYDGISIRGVGVNGNVSYIVTVDNLRCGFMNAPLGEWSEYEIELLGDLDVLIIPAEDVKKVQAIVEEVDPPLVIPMRTADDKIFNEVVAACGGKDTETVKEIKLKKSSLPTESREVYVLG